MVYLISVSKMSPWLYNVIMLGLHRIATNLGPIYQSGLILGLRPTNERRRYFVTTSLIGWAQT